MDALYDRLPSSSFLEYAFLRWVLFPAVRGEIAPHVIAQHRVDRGEKTYYLDYLLRGARLSIAIELDGFEFHGTRHAFTYDRMRQNDLVACGLAVVRFSYESIRSDTKRCVEQLQSIMGSDEFLRGFIVPSPVVEIPDMNPDPMYSLLESPSRKEVKMVATHEENYFSKLTGRIKLDPLRLCQRQAFTELTTYYQHNGKRAACVMSVGAGKTVLGILCVLAFTKVRAMIVTPGNVIRGTFDRAFDHEAPGNALYGLPGGPIIPGSPPPRVLTLDRDLGSISSRTREELEAADVLITNFHTLGSGDNPEDLLTKLSPESIDMIVVDEAHIAAAESYQRMFSHFSSSRILLMSACFQRLDGKPLEGDVVYRYRLIDAIADGNAKNLRVRRFTAQAEETTYEMVWPDGAREEFVGREALLEVLKDERKLAAITAKSFEPIRHVMRIVKQALDEQTQLLNPIKPRVLFSALGERHAEQIARIANEHGIPTDYLHHSMTDKKIASIRQRYEKDSGDLSGIVHLKMLGQGYDFPAITIVVPMRPYGSFSEFYQFIGRGIRAIIHPSLKGRVDPDRQLLDIIYHSEFGLDEHIETIYRENDMDPQTIHEVSFSAGSGNNQRGDLAVATGIETAGHPETLVLFQQGLVNERVVHDEARIEQRKREREREALAQKYAEYASQSSTPVSFDQYVEIIEKLTKKEGP